MVSMSELFSRILFGIAFVSILDVALPLPIAHAEMQRCRSSSHLSLLVPTAVSFEAVRVVAAVEGDGGIEDDAL